MRYPSAYVITGSLAKEVLILSKKKQHSRQFKSDAVQYRKEHPDLSQVGCARNPGTGTSTLSRWESQYRDNSADIPTRGSGNYSSDGQKEIARLKRELRDAQDAPDVLKKPSAFRATTDRSCPYRSFRQGRGCQSRTPPGLYLWNAEIFRRIPFRLPCFPSQKTFRLQTAQGNCQKIDPADL